MAPSLRPYVHTQPRLSRLSLQGFLDLPRRLCAPPPAVGKVRSFGLTPIFNVTLEDVLDRKLLPPLSLKDFEEWLLYVEQCPENLYFIIWLREYTLRYDHWMAKVRSRERRYRERMAKRPRLSSANAGTAQGQATQAVEPEVASGASTGLGSYRITWAAHSSPSLAIFFARARETFFAPMSPYELVLPPHLLAPFFVGASGGAPLSPHPDPAVFGNLKAHIENALRASLTRFVRAAYTNVGTYRAACGIAAGIFMLVAGAIPPIAVNFTFGHSRWLRLACLPGLWIGLTILVASLRGVCIMIYVFGDFRQLRKFELERPPLPNSPTASDYKEKSLNSPAPLFLNQGLASVSVTVPTQPVRALTAPPKISVRIPTRPSVVSTPAFTLGTSSHARLGSIGLSTSEMTVSRNGSNGAITETTLHTISISSLKSRTGVDSVSHWDMSPNTPVGTLGIYKDYANMDPETRSLAPSIPAYAPSISDEGSDYAIDDEERRCRDIHGCEEASSDDEDEDDEDGIYISPAYNPPTEIDENDPAVLTVALALIGAQQAQIQGNEGVSGSDHSAAGGVSLRPDIMPAGIITPTGVSLGPIPPGAVTSAVSVGTPVNPPAIHQTAGFIPAFPYSSEMVDILAPVAVSSLGHASINRSRKNTDCDLEAGSSKFSASISATRKTPLLPLGTFDFDALPSVVPSRRKDGSIELRVDGKCDPIDISENAAKSERGIYYCERTQMSSGRPRSSWVANTITSLARSLRATLSERLSSSCPSPAQSHLATHPWLPRSTSGGRAGESGCGGSNSWRKRAAGEQRVPAFGPVTRVLEPVVARAQWEIVVRAAYLAALTTIIVVGTLLALPIPTR